MNIIYEMYKFQHMDLYTTLAYVSKLSMMTHLM